jgi:hypothetical protein
MDEDDEDANLFPDMKWKDDDDDGPAKKPRDTYTTTLPELPTCVTFVLSLFCICICYCLPILKIPYNLGIVL